MNEIELAKVITKLKPDSEFSFQNADYSTIEWHKLEGEAPTIQEIQQVYANWKIDEEKEAKAKADAKAALLAKLGITEQEAALLLS